MLRPLQQEDTFQILAYKKAFLKYQHRMLTGSLIPSIYWVGVGVGGGKILPTLGFFPNNSKMPKDNKMKFFHCNSMPVRKFCIHWQCSLFWDVTMATHCFQCITSFLGWKNEWTWTMSKTMDWSYSNLVEGVLLGSEFKFIKKIFYDIILTSEWEDT